MGILKYTYLIAVDIHIINFLILQLVSFRVDYIIMVNKRDSFLDLMVFDMSYLNFNNRFI